MDDIQGLVSSILDEIARVANRPRLPLSRDAIQALINYRWPGNIRELRNALERAVTLARTDLIMIEDLPEKISHETSRLAKTNGTRLKEREREYIMRVLADSPSLDQAAATLGINVTTLWRKRKRYGIR
jgi:NtrC-family two-component system response regulator AlgB